jgi:tungstate transport system substrate-binding protein
MDVVLISVMISHRIRHLPVVVGLALILAFASVPAAAPPVLRLATTTSTDDSGLLKALLPAFEQKCACRVEVIAVGTGQALEIGRRGDADVLLVHARQAEDQFVAEHHARERRDVMYNDFVVVGPAADPARIAGIARASDALSAIAKAAAPFVSRGDRSGTDTKEKELWAAAKLSPAGSSWYRSVGQGMGETLVTANELLGYTLADRGTWLSMRDRLPALRLLLGGKTIAENQDPTLRNPYGVMAVNPDVHPGVNFALATRMVEWLVSPETQRAIGDFGRERFGQPLFYSAAEDPRTTRDVTVNVGPVTRTLTLDDLRALPRSRLDRHAVVGVKMGPLGVHDWAGASLADVLVKADPGITARAHAGSRIVVTSSDGWTATLFWDEIFSNPPPGLQIYNTKGCNECHGVLAEGTAPAAKRPAPALAGRPWTVDGLLALLRAGGDRHAGMNGYTESQLRRADLQVMIEWLRRPAAASREASRPAPDRPVVLLAYERDGQPLPGRDGLIQLVVGQDEFAGRYSHWVKTITVVR